MLLFGVCCVYIHVITLLRSHTDARDKYNLTPLHRACLGGCIQVVQYLVEELQVDVGK